MTEKLRDTARTIDTADTRDTSKLYPRRSNRKKATHAKIIHTALTLFRKNGYKNTTMANIADQADVHVTTVFNHFAAKKDLMQAITADALVNVERHIEKNRGKESFFSFYRKTIKMSANYQKQQSQESQGDDWFPRDDPEILPAWVSYEAQQAKLFAQCIAQDYGLDVDLDPRPTLVANMLIAGSVQTYQRWRESGCTTDLLADSLLVIDAAEQLVGKTLASKFVPQQWNLMCL